ncbi:hypothetical protein NC651_005912 [Populus alba x Populus x berolinensis]|nr:hypothetical protein NC651_005912 [Populus alba x Populus x berolinensis]
MPGNLNGSQTSAATFVPDRVGCIISTRRGTAPPFLFNLKKYLVIQDHNMKPERQHAADLRSV